MRLSKNPVIVVLIHQFVIARSEFLSDEAISVLLLNAAYLKAYR